MIKNRPYDTKTGCRNINSESGVKIQLSAEEVRREIEKHRQWLTISKFYQHENDKADFSGKVICDMDLSHMNLYGANLRDVKLKNVNLSGADLRNTDMLFANLENVDLSKADLSGSVLKFADVKKSNFSNAVLCKADMHYAHLESADMNCAKFFETTLIGAHLNNANLSNADLRWANCGYADFSYAKLHETNFRNANCSHADFSCTELHKTNFRDAYCSNACFKYASLKQAVLYYGNFQKAIFEQADMQDTDIEGANFSYSKLENAKNVPHIPYACPETGNFIGYKKCHRYIVVLEIPKDAKRSSATNEACKCNKAKVIKIENMDGTTAKISEISSYHDENFIYRVNEEVSVPDFNENRWIVNCAGIHFFMDKELAKSCTYSVVSHEEKNSIITECPKTGSFIGYKKCHDYILTLKIPEDAKRLSVSFPDKSVRMYKCDKATVLHIENIKGIPVKISQVTCEHNNDLIYRIGEEVTFPDFTEDEKDIYGTGICFFMDKIDAKRFNYSASARELQEKNDYMFLYLG